MQKWEDFSAKLIWYNLVLIIKTILKT
jgi:hypothetical protein